MPGLTKREVAEWIVRDGLGETIENGLSYMSINDPLISEKWKQCSDLMEEIYYILEPYLDKY